MTRPTSDEAGSITQPGGGASDSPPDRVATPAVEAAPAGRRSWQSLGTPDVAGLLVVAAAVIFAYAPNFARLVATWWNEPDYTHGFLVLPICAYIAWRRWPGPDDERPETSWVGWPLVLAALVARVYLHERGASWSETATFLPVVVGLTLSRVGWPTFRRIWPAFAFMLFCLPLPPALNATLSQPLQSMATSGSCRLLRLTGLWVMPEGNVILVGNERLEVAAACNGLSMLMSLAATVAATASLVPMATVKRVVLLASIIPIALTSNILRISVTAWCYYQFGAKVGGEYAHDIAGWMMMPLAMALVFVELAIMSWLIIEARDTSRTIGLLAMDRTPKAWNPEGRS